MPGEVDFDAIEFTELGSSKLIWNCSSNSPLVASLISSNLKNFVKFGHKTTLPLPEQNFQNNLELHSRVNSMSSKGPLAYKGDKNSQIS